MEWGRRRGWTSSFYPKQHPTAVKSQPWLIPQLAWHLHVRIYWEKPLLPLLTAGHLTPYFSLISLACLLALITLRERERTPKQKNSSQISFPLPPPPPVWFLFHSNCKLPLNQERLKIDQQKGKKETLTDWILLAADLKWWVLMEELPDLIWISHLMILPISIWPDPSIDCKGKRG